MQETGANCTGVLPLSEQELSSECIRVAVLLLGLDRDGLQRTQKEVCEHSGMSKSCVSKHVARMLDSGYICKATLGRQNILYGKGKNYPILESQMDLKVMFDMVREAANSLNRGPVTASAKSDGPPMSVKLHIPGSACRFKVLKEGSIEETRFKEGFPPQQIFGQNGKRKSGLKGSEDWDGVFLLTGEKSARRYSIRYQRTKNNRTFYIDEMEGVMMTKYESLDKEIVRRKFLASCFPMLAWLEKYAGWEFEKDGTGNYVMLNEIRLDRIHFVGVGPVFDLMMECCGNRKFGVSGETGAWIDASPGHNEMEFGSQEYVGSVIALPGTTSEVRRMSGDLGAIKADIERTRAEHDAMLAKVNSIDAILGKTVDTLHDTVKVVGTIADAQNTAVKELSMNVAGNGGTEEKGYSPSNDEKCRGMFG